MLAVGQYRANMTASEGVEGGYAAPLDSLRRVGKYMLER